MLENALGNLLLLLLPLPLLPPDVHLVDIPQKGDPRREDCPQLESERGFDMSFIEFIVDTRALFSRAVLFLIRIYCRSLSFLCWQQIPINHSKSWRINRSLSLSVSVSPDGIQQQRTTFQRWGRRWPIERAPLTNRASAPCRFFLPLAIQSFAF